MLEYPEGMKGKWNTFFNNEHPVVLELACGKGEYAVGLGRQQPFRNFIGVDIKGNRIWVGARQALEEGLHHVAFLRTQIGQISGYFAKDEVSEIWITFPDPQLRSSKAKKRLTHPRFLRLYQAFLKQGGKIHLKTDSPDLYHFTKLVAQLYHLPVLADIDDVYSQKDLPPELVISTHYEKLDIAGSNRIFYICFSLPEHLADNDDELTRLIKETSAEKT